MYYLLTVGSDLLYVINKTPYQMHIRNQVEDCFLKFKIKILILKKNCALVSKITAST